LPRVEAPDGWVKKVERAHVSVFPQRDTLLLTLIILVIALISRLFGCGLGALRLGWSDPVRLGVGMMPRGEVGLVVAQIGLGFGVMPVQIYAAVVFMSLATTILAPPMLNRAFRHVHPVEPVEDFMIR
jgi:Kef-type K+ transport system membrane component KefB